MHKEISFKNMPFCPIGGQIIYVESGYTPSLNRFIRKNYAWIKKIFLQRKLNFCYLPLLAEETVRYNAPYLTDKERESQVSFIPNLFSFLATPADVPPSLIFALDIPVKDANGDIVLQSLTIDTKWYIPTAYTFKKLVEELCIVYREQSCKYHKLFDKPKPARIKYSIKVPHEPFPSPARNVQYCLEEDGEPMEYPSADYDERRNIRFHSPERDRADKDFDYMSQQLVSEIVDRINALRDRGINTMFLHNLIDEGEKISRLKITEDYRIILIDYNNLEIKMPVLTKAVFLLFLKHPEGIRFKELSDYYSELLQIYLKMNPNGGKQKQENSIRDLTDPCSNSINEKCARIREAFVTNFDERLARNYYVTGKRGEAKKIELEESMIIWE